MTTESQQWKKSFIQFISGGTAGFVEVAMLHPLDLVKTRMQLQKGPPNPKDPNYYTGIVDCFRKLKQNEGVLSFWKGILPPLIIETPTKSVRFTTFHFCKKIFSNGKKPNILTNMGCAYFAGVAESFVICPFEVVKVTQQANLSHATKAPSAWGMANTIISKDGIFGKRGIYRGCGATIYRHSIYCAIYLGLFYQNSFHNTLITLFIGIATSGCACFFNIPFDVVKSRIQAPQPKKIKYRNTWQSINVVLKEEGFLALYKGLTAKLLRLAPGGAIIIFVFELTEDYLTSILQ